MLQGRSEGHLESRAKRCAYVWQNPENQIVTDRVEYEIVFGLENIGMSKEQMERRLAEMVTFFGLEDLINRDTMHLSGGEMQTVNIAAAVAMNPDLLLLDEPTSQLDPVAARRLYELLHQINEELGVTVVLAEQRLAKAVTAADKMVLLEKGKIIAQGTPSEVYGRLRETSYINYFPSYMCLHREWTEGKECPLSMKELRQWFENNFTEKDSEKFAEDETGEDETGEKKNGKEKTGADKEDYILCKNLFFRYEKNMPEVLDDCSCRIRKGNITCLAGGNGSGKTTLLEVLAGRYRPYRGRVKNMPKNCAVLPGQPSYLFLEDTLEAEWNKATDRTKGLMQRFGLGSLMKQHPADLSGGERQRLGLSIVLGREADVYLLDEPSKGLDYKAKKILGEILRELKGEGKTVFIISHDMEFAAVYADEMALMFRGRVELLTKTRKFFEENQFYTTSINRIARGVSKHIITQEDVGYYAQKKKCD